MKIQLIHPPHPTATDDKLDAPLGLLYIAASLKNNGYDAMIADLCGFKKREEWESRIIEADLYGLTSYICTMNLSAEIAKMCKRKNPNSRIVGGGANLTGICESVTNGKSFIPDEYDSIVVGAGELAILDVMEDFPNLKPTYKHPLENNLDVYPNPDYDMVDIKSYHRTINEEQSISILTSRGCPFRCAFCGLPKQNRIVRYRSPEAVANEIKNIIEKYGIRAFNFQDDTFMVDKKRVYELMELLGPLDIKFRVLGRAGLDSKEDYRRLKDAGCNAIGWGIESGSQEILDKMNKQVTVRQNREVIAWAQELGILDRVFIVLGFPGETARTIEETRKFIEEANPSQNLASTFQPYPGTQVWNNPRKFGVKRIYTDFSKYVQINGDGIGAHCNIDTEWLRREELESLQMEFRLWLNARRRRGPLQEYEKKLEQNREKIDVSLIPVTTMQREE